MLGWPAGFDFNENNYELDGSWNETPEDQRLTGLNVFRNPEHARMLCFEGVRFSLNLVQSGITQGCTLLIFWLESLWTVQCEFPPNTKPILQWAYASRDWIRSQFNAELADFKDVNIGELIDRIKRERNELEHATNENVADELVELAYGLGGEAPEKADA